MSFRIDQLAVLNLATVGNSITAGSFVKSGGTSSQFLKADGSVDSSAYITGITSGMVTTALGYTPVPNTRNITINGVTQDLSVDRTWTISAGVSSVSGSGAGISVSPTTGAVVVSNTGVTSNVAGTGISVSGATGAVTITNTGVTSIVAGTAITVSGATGAVTINNAGVTSVNGSTGALTGFATQAWVTSQGYITGNQTITLSGDVTGSGTTSIATTLANSGVVAGTYGGNNSIPSLAIDAKGRVTSASTVTPSGTWGISISGNAATATNANTVGGVSASQIVYGNTTTRRGTWEISNWNQTTYPDVAFLSSENGTANAPTSDYSYGLQYSFHRSGAAYRTQMVTSLYSDLNIWVRNSRDSDVWTAWKVLLHSGNYNSYAPTLTGGGASGTWGINITGTAGSETLQTVTSRGASTTSTLTSTNVLGLYVNSGSYSYIGINSASNWAYVSLQNNGSTSWDIASYAGGSLEFRPYGSNGNRIAMTLGGNLGVGTVNPSGRLHVYQGSATDTYLESGTGGTTGKLIFKTSDNSDLNKYIMQDGYWTVIGTHSNEGLRVRDSGGNILINIAGSTNGYPNRVGIGNTTPSYKLHVSGDIYADGGWLRVSGTAGLYFESYGGGWRMTDSSYIRTYNNKALSMEGASVDYVGSIYMNGGVYIQTNNNRNLQVTSSGAGDNGIYGRGNSGQFCYQIYGDGGGNYGFLNSVWGAWDLKKNVGNGNLYMNDNNTYYLNTNGTSYLYRVDAADQMRAPIFYDSDNTAYYLNPASSSTSLRIAGGIAQNDIVGRPAAYWGAGGGTTGAVVIKFPGTTGNYGMVHAVIDIYEYNGNDACTVIVGGHNWGGAWYNYGAQVVGSTDKPVRVGVKDGQYCIVIGNGSSSWSYGQVVLRKIQNGTYYSGVMDVAGGYTVAIESDTYSWISGDLRNLETPLNFYAGSNIYMGGNLVATQSWVNSQGFVTGGPFVPSRSQSNWNDGTVIGNTVGMLAWKNYGNGHVIFDASASTSPSGSGVNNTNSQIAWSSTYPTLMGWNGSNTYGVRVDSARISDNTSGNADTVDGFHASQSTIANGIVVRDGNGYIFGNYINMTDDGNPGGGTSISSFITKQGDNYYRSVSPTNAMVSIRGVASGSWGINITGSSSSSTTASYLPTLYAGGVQTNPQVYFGQSIGLRVAMTGVPFAWCDTLWINGYSGGDVLSMTALHTARNGQPRMWLSTQSSNGTSYGTTYEFLTEWNYTNYTLPIGGSWYGVNMPGSRWGGYAVSGGEIVFGNGLPNAGQMGMLIDGAYVAGENNGFWSLPSNNDWNGRRGMYWDGTYLNFTANSPTSVFTTLRLANGFELQQGGSNYGQFNSWVHLPGFHGLYSGQNSAHIYPNNGTYGSWMMSGSRNGWQGIEFNSGSAGNITLMVNTNSNESGFHNNSYGWQIFWSGGALYAGRNTYGGNHSRVLQEDVWINSKYFGSDGYIYGVRFSDASDGAYYCDPNGESNLWRFTAQSMTRNAINYLSINSPYSTRAGQAGPYLNGTMGWGQIDFNTIFSNWGSGFIDTWSNPGNAPGGSSHYVGIQGLHYNHQNNTNGYGFQMACAGEADNRFFWRSAWPSLRSWVEMIHSGNIGSQNVNYATTAGTASFAANSGNTNSVSNATGGTYTWTGINYFRSNLGGYCGSLSNPPLQAYSDSNNSAFFSFHKGGYYAVNMGLDADSVLRIGGWSASANRWQLDMSGNMTVAGDVTAYSDARVKENIETVEDALDKVLNLRGVYYNRTDSEDKRRKVGVIAQEILEVIPEVVGQDNDGMYNVSYGNIVGVLIEAIKEQQKQIDELKARLD